VFDDPALEVRTIIVNLWWEQVAVGDYAMRARVSTTVAGAPIGPSGGAATIEGIIAAVRAAAERFVASPPPGIGGPHG
jgi:hypothetical protein